MSDFDTDFAALEDDLAEVFGDDVVLSRSPATAAIRAELLDFGAAVDEQTGLLLGYDFRTWLVLAADYAFAGVAVEPQAGDRITQTIGGAAAVFELMAETGKPCFERDQSGRHYIIRSKRVT